MAGTVRVPGRDLSLDMKFGPRLRRIVTSIADVCLPSVTVNEANGCT